MPNPVVHFEILGRDGPALQSFYAELFGWKVDASNPLHYGTVEAQGRGIGGGIAPTDLMVGHVTVYVEVNDLDAYLAKAEALGGRIMMPPTEVPGGPAVALFADTEGHTIGLVKAST
jgi:hypothetical protein